MEIRLVTSAATGRLGMGEISGERNPPPYVGGYGLRESCNPVCKKREAVLYSLDMIHVGIGYDVHPLVPGRKLVLGGVEIPHIKGLDGHSDADALMHAVCDAVLGALGEGDIGTFFSNTDPRWKDAPSRIFLEEAARQ